MYIYFKLLCVKKLIMIGLKSNFIKINIFINFTLKNNSIKTNILSILL